MSLEDVLLGIRSPKRDALRLRVERMEQALSLIGYSHHSGLPRFGEKAQIARWGLGLDDLPEGYVEGHRVLDE